MKPASRPTYQTRAMQVAACLREKMAKGEWQERLPGERILAQELGIGRTTLRHALDLLKEEGLVEKMNRMGTRLTHPAGVAPRRTRKVGLLLEYSLEAMPHNGLMMIHELRRFLQLKKVELYLHDATTSSKRGIFPFFRHLYETLHYDGWILRGGTREMQQWCAAQQLPVILASTRFPGVELPSVETHFRAVCRHAVGEMVRRGHRQIALVLPRTPTNSGPGDIESRLGFLEAAEEFHPAGVRCTVELYSGTTTSLYKLADTMLARSSRPTGWLVPTPYFLTMMVYLLKNKVRIPEEVSLVCRDSELYHQNITPVPTRYWTDMRIKAKQVGNLVQHLLTNTNAPSEVRLVMPEFLPGETLGPAPRQ